MFKQIKTIIGVTFLVLALSFLAMSQPIKANTQNYDCAAQSAIPQLECEALIKIAEVNPQSRFAEGGHPCTWNGVNCDSNSKSVTDLDLRYRGVLNEIPYQLTSLPSEIGDLTNLETLNLNDNKLSVLPIEIRYLNNLESLSIRSNLLESLPPDIGQLNSLTDLNVGHNQVESLPIEIGQLTNLKSLNLAGNSLTNLPDEIGQLVNLESLGLSNNELNILPSTFGQLTNLRHLTMGPNHLENLPLEFGNLILLEYLYLGENKLKELPNEFGNLVLLETLYLNDNQLEKLPDEFGQLINLENLYLSLNQLKSLPETIGNLTKLSTADFESNHLASLPSSVGNLTELYQITLSHNQLSSLPSEIGGLDLLRYLYLADNQLMTLPDEIGQIDKLMHLDLDNNYLTNLPQGIGSASTLFEIKLSANQLENLPKEIGLLKTLEVLDLSSNQLQSLPVEIGQLSSLEYLNLNFNELTSIPSEIGQLDNLYYLEISHNLLNNLPTGFGQMTNLRRLNLSSNELNDFSAEVSELSNLGDLFLDNNPLNGPLPISFLDLEIYALSFHNTGLCIPDTIEFANWLDRFNKNAISGAGIVCGQELGSISGSVIGSNGQPATAGSIVSAYQRTFSSMSNPNPLIASKPITSDGTYRIEGLDEGLDYILHVTSPDNLHPPQYYQGEASVWEADPITVTLDALREDVDIDLISPKPQQQPVTTVETKNGFVATDPFLGIVNIVQSKTNKSEITVTQVVLCNDGTSPVSAYLTLGTRGEIAGSMSLTNNENEYTGIIPTYEFGNDDFYVTAYCSENEGNRLEEERTLIGNISTYDPIGTISNSVTKLPVSNATVTLYHISNWQIRKNRSDTRLDTCESNNSKDFNEEWSQEAPLGNGFLANLDIFDASPLGNQQITDEGGTYGWDLPSGCWYVIVEADNYLTLKSPVVGLSSTIDDLNLELTPDGFNNKIYLPFASN